MRIRLPLTLVLLLIVLPAGAQKTPLPGQVIVDPLNGSYLVYNRDLNRDGKLDPAFLIGPGDPEGFLFLGERQPDGTRAGGEQATIIRRLKAEGGNAIYFMAQRSHGGDGTPNQNPFVDPTQPASGLDPDILRQWQGWFVDLENAGVTAYFFLFDDGAHPFDDGCTGTVGPDEEAYIRGIVDAFERFPNLIWVVQEEFKFVGHDGKRRPCDEVRVRKIARVVDIIHEADDHPHPIGVHHNVGEPMAYPDNPWVDVYVQQANLIVEDRRGDLDTLHAAGQIGKGYDAAHRYQYTMGEGYNWHHALMEKKDRAMLRRSYYAAAMNGANVLVLGMFGAEGPPTPQMLKDMRVMQRFFEATNFNEMAPADERATADTKWVLAAPDWASCILYTNAGGRALGISDLKPGSYTARWLDPVTGKTRTTRHRVSSPEPSFLVPEGIGPEVIVHLQRR